MKAIYLITILTLASCTVTKRVHRPGFNVEWNRPFYEKNEKNTFEKEETSIKLNSEETEVSEDQKVQVIPEQYSDELISSDQVENSETRPSQSSNNRFQFLKNNEAFFKPQTTIQTFIKTAHKHYKPQRITQNKAPGSDLISWGILLLILAGILALFAVLTMNTPISTAALTLALFGVPLAFYFAFKLFKRAKETKTERKAYNAEQKARQKEIADARTVNVKNDISTHNDKTINPSSSKQNSTNQEVDNLAIGSVILLVGLIIPFVGFLCLIGSFVLSIISISRNKRLSTPLKYHGLAWIPIVLFIIALVVLLFILMMFI